MLMIIWKYISANVVAFSFFIHFPTYSRENNIMKEFEILVQISFTTSKAGLDFWYNKLCIQVSSRVA